ncbi:MAG: dihydrofolate reductase family protein [Vicinamibacteraceae bacterium]
MRQLRSFTSISLDGYFTDASGDMTWAHKRDDEWNAFSSSNARGGAALLFGRVTYEMMKAFWSTPQAAAMLPDVAKGMNAMPKFVASRTLAAADWQNTTVLRGDLVAAVKALKASDGPDVVILGSGSLVSQLSEARLIDEYQLVLNAVALGKGGTLFETLDGRQAFTLKKTKAFQNGNVVLWYDPA